MKRKCFNTNDKNSTRAPAGDERDDWSDPDERRPVNPIDGFNAGEKKQGATANFHEVDARPDPDETIPNNPARSETPPGESARCEWNPAEFNPMKMQLISTNITTIDDPADRKFFTPETTSPILDVTINKFDELLVKVPPSVVHRVRRCESPEARVTLRIIFGEAIRWNSFAVAITEAVRNRGYIPRFALFDGLVEIRSTGLITYETDDEGVVHVQLHFHDDFDDDESDDEPQPLDGGDTKVPLISLTIVG